MDGDVRRRAACDRCHAQKLRCPKRPGAEVCDRCIRARTSCAFSPFRQKKDPDIENDTISRTDGSQVPIVNNEAKKAGDNDESIIFATRTKRRRTSFRPKTIFPDHEFTLQSSSTEANQGITGTADLEWMSNVSPLLHDFEIDPTFASIDFENQDWYPPFEFNPPPYMNQADQNQKINNTVQVRSPFDAGRPQNKISSQPLLGAEVAPPRSSSKNYAILSQGSGRDIQRCQNPGPESLIRQLSELTIGLHEHSKKIPPQSIHDPILQSELGAEDTSANSRPQDYANYCLDETFQMTQDLINIYPFFISTFLCRESTGTGIVEPSAWRQYSVSEDPISQEIRPPIAPSLSNPLAVDHPSILLILSCHLRLIDIYEELFKHMEICIAQKGIACTPAQVSYVGTPLKIGSYVPPPSAAVPMQMLLLIQFASQLAEHAADLVSGLKRSPNGDGEGCLGEAVAEGSRDGKLVSCLLSADTVNCRASDMAQHLNSLRVKMLQMGFLA